MRPTISTSAFIGHRGDKAFSANVPDDWILEAEPRQGGDFGFDKTYFLRRSGHIDARFSVQLKSSETNSEIGEEQDAFAVPLARETCNLFVRDGHPVMLAYVDLRGVTATKDAPVYYAWVHEQLIARLNGRDEFVSSDPKSITVHISKADRLTPDTDIGPYLEAYGEVNRRAREFSTADDRRALANLAQLPPEATAAFGLLDTQQATIWLQNSALGGDAPWALPDPDSPLARVKEFADAISAGRLELAATLNAALSHAISTASPDVRAEYAYQSGRLSMMLDDAKAGSESFDQARRLLPENARYTSAFIESAIISGAYEEPARLDELLTITSCFDDDSVRFQRARIYAIRGEQEALTAELAQMKGAEALKAQVLTRMIERDWAVAQNIADNGVQQQDARTRHFLMVLSALATYHELFAGVERIVGGGPVSIDVTRLVDLQKRLLVTLQAARQLGWPANSEQLIPVAAAVATCLGENVDISAHVARLAEARLWSKPISLAVLAYATALNRPELAKECLAHVTLSDVEHPSLLVMTLVEVGDFRRAVDEASALLNFPHSDRLAAVGVSAGSHAAWRLGLSETQAVFDTWLGDERTESSVRAMHDFARAMAIDPGSRDAQVAKLLDKWRADGDSHLLQDNLAHNLRPDRPNEARSLLEIVRAIETRRGLTQDEAERKVASMVTLAEFAEAEIAAARLIERFAASETLYLYRAVALDHLGRNADADRVLSEIAGPPSERVLSLHAQVALRSGDLDRAEHLFQRALADATRERRFAYRKYLMILARRRGAGAYEEAAWNLGEICDRDSEEEESVFLVNYLLATAPESVRPSGDRIAAFQERLSAFVARFPDSRHLRAVQMDEAAGAEELMAGLRKVAGVTDESEKRRARAWNFVNANPPVVPLAWRPKLFLPFVDGPASLLSYIVSAGEHTLWARGVNGVSGKAINRQGDLAKRLFVDALTLLALSELEMLELLARLSPEIVMARGAYDQITEAALSPLDSGSSLASRCLTRLRQSGVTISFLPEVNEAEGDQAAPVPIQEFRRLVRQLHAEESMSFVCLDGLYIDAVVEKGIDGSRCLTIPALLAGLHAAGHARDSETYLSLIRLGSWNLSGRVLSSENAAAALGHLAGVVPASSAHTLLTSDDEVAKAIRHDLRGSTDLDEVFSRLADVAILALETGSEHVPAVISEYFRVAYREIFLANRLEVGVDPANFAAAIAFCCVLRLDDAGADQDSMYEIWRVVRDAYLNLVDLSEVAESNLLRAVGSIAAKFASRAVSTIGDMVREERIRSMFFSVAVAGTAERDTLDAAYFQQVEQLLVAAKAEHPRPDAWRKL